MRSLAKLQLRQTVRGTLVEFRVPESLGICLPEEYFERYAEIALRKRPDWELLRKFLENRGALCLNLEEKTAKH